VSVFIAVLQFDHRRLSERCNINEHFLIRGAAREENN
jgi:hypothetical protein